jgi:hypothetical protein
VGVSLPVDAVMTRGALHGVPASSSAFWSVVGAEYTNETFACFMKSKLCEAQLSPHKRERERV